MNTIVRDTYGLIDIKKTVVKTMVTMIRSKSGAYRIVDIQRAINNQIQPQEALSYKKVKRAVVDMLAEIQKSNKRAIDK